MLHTHCTTFVADGVFSTYTVSTCIGNVKKVSIAEFTPHYMAIYSTSGCGIYHDPYTCRLHANREAKMYVVLQYWGFSVSLGLHSSVTSHIPCWSPHTISVGSLMHSVLVISHIQFWLSHTFSLS